MSSYIHSLYNVQSSYMLYGQYTGHRTSINQSIQSMKHLFSLKMWPNKDIGTNSQKHNLSPDEAIYESDGHDPGYIVWEERWLGITHRSTLHHRLSIRHARVHFWMVVASILRGDGGEYISGGERDGVWNDGCADMASNFEFVFMFCKVCFQIYVYYYYYYYYDWVWIE